MRPFIATPTVGAKVQQIEADLHRFGWHTMNPMAHVITVDGDRLRYQMLARPEGIHPKIPPTTRSPRTRPPPAGC
jgi:hypothetical protein